MGYCIKIKPFHLNGFRDCRQETKMVGKTWSTTSTIQLFKIVCLYLLGIYLLVHQVFSPLFTLMINNFALKNNFRFIIRICNRIQFWNDIWVSDKPLFLFYQRLYQMSCQQFNSTIGFWDNDCWYWNLIWNWCFRNKENDHLQSMINAINLIDLHNYKENRNFWSINGKGHYTC
jgi:hypothetical protein